MRGIKPNNYSLEEENIAIVCDALGHPIRKRIINLLKDDPGLTQQDLFQCLPLCPSSIFRHLNKLKEANVIKYNYNVHYFPMNLNVDKLKELKYYLDELIDD